jgi:hypothetical protein
MLLSPQSRQPWLKILSKALCSWQDNEKPGKEGFGHGEPCYHPAAASNPKCSRNEEKRCRKLVNKLNGCEPNQVLIFSDEKFLWVMWL